MVRIISYEALNRGGKGTQIGLMKSCLDSIGIPTLILRGDGSRPGLGGCEFYDPQSDWWQRWQNNSVKTLKDWERAYTVLCKDNEDAYTEFALHKKDGWVLMDRSYLSRWYMMRKENPDIGIEEASKTTILHPQIYISLEVPKDVLLSRVSDDNPSKTEFRRQAVRDGYELWVDTLEKAKAYLDSRVISIDGTRNKEDIHKSLVDLLL